MTGLPCPNCGSELALLEQYQRHYCYACGRYAPEGFGDRGAKRCPMCTGILSYVTQYDRYYCFRCNAYPPEGVFMEMKVETQSSPAPEPAAETTQTALVVVEPSRAEEPKPVPVVEDANPETVEVPAEPTPQPEPETREEEEIPSDEPVAPVAKPVLVRAEILEARKLVLMDLCKAYDFDPSGTKEELRERLLSYLDQEEADQQRATATEEIRAEIPQETRAEPTVAPAQTEPVVEQKVATRKVITAAPRMIPELPKKVVDTFPTPAAATVSPGMDTSPTPTIVIEPFVPSAAATPAREPIIEERPMIPTAKVEHPCPTCSRELTYIPQYNRWYCYSCRRYAPKARSKFACPNCGAALRWISQYERWWCDACRKYAPADLPKPERAAIMGTSTGAFARGTSMTAAAIVHRHRSPGSGIGLVGFGIALFVLYEILVDLPIALAIRTGSFVGPDIAFGLRFFAFVFVAVGAILGLSAVRDQR